MRLQISPELAGTEWIGRRLTRSMSALGSRRPTFAPLAVRPWSCMAGIKPAEADGTEPAFAGRAL